MGKVVRWFVSVGENIGHLSFLEASRLATKNFYEVNFSASAQLPRYLPTILSYLTSVGETVVISSISVGQTAGS